MAGTPLTYTDVKQHGHGLKQWPATFGDF